MNKITVWKRLNKGSDKFEHNHIEDGFASTDTPIPKNIFQSNAWKDAIWKKCYAELIDGSVCVID